MSTINFLGGECKALQASKAENLTTMY
jgi:hypothetical protein